MHMMPEPLSLGVASSSALVASVMIHTMRSERSPLASRDALAALSPLKV